MKKIYAAILVLAMAVSVTACNNDTSMQSQSGFATGDISSISDNTDSSAENSNLQNENDTEYSYKNDDSKNESSLQEPADNDNYEQGSNILVAYFSRVGNTNWEDEVDAVTSASLNVMNGEYFGNAQLLADMAQQTTSGDLFLIQTEEPYPSDYRQTTDKAKEEQNDNARPALVSHVDNMDKYETIVLVYPNWWGTLPQPLFTFLEEYDFSGKTILPLCTHGGSCMGSSESDISLLCPNAMLLEGLAISGSDAASAQSDVEAWINNSGILE